MVQTSSLPGMVYLRAIRVHQWVKNLLVFVPLVMAHLIFDGDKVWLALRAFLSFSFCASSVYILNDILDVESDKRHHRKRHRPLASGELSLLAAWILIPLLLLLGIAIACTLPQSFRQCLLVYYALTCLYSFYIKKIIVADIVLLASLYAIRILAGGHAVSVEVSQWLLAFSMFFFLSLACIKRFSELKSIRQENSEENSRRGYLASDLEQIAQFGSASGYISVLVLALYVSSKEVSVLYSHASLIWLCCPLLLYWVSRAWLLAHRGCMHDDPIVFAMRDRVSYLVGAISAALLFFAA